MTLTKRARHCTSLCQNWKACTRCPVRFTKFKTTQNSFVLYATVADDFSLYPIETGEAEYVNDIPKHAGELAGIFVTATVANATLKNVDASEALVSWLLFHNSAQAFVFWGILIALFCCRLPQELSPS